MIALPLEVVADDVGGRVEGEASVVISGPVLIDGREAEEGSLFVAFVGEHADGHDHVPQAAANGAVAVLGTRATELPTVVVDDPQVALGRLAAYVVAQVRSDALTVVALTGSQGKTSTKDLLAAVLGRAGKTVATYGSFNNELGMPLTALRVEPDTRYLVLEMGARGRGHLTELTDLVAPDLSVVLNVGTAHLGEFGSRDAIAEAKGELVEALGPDGTAVLNADDERVAAMAGRTDARVLTFGRMPGADVRITDEEPDRLGRPTFRLGGERVRLQLVGAHQALNAAAAAAAAVAVGLPLPQVAAALADVRSLSKWRMELHELPSGVVLLNDSYNANPESMRAALDALAAMRGVRRRVAVLGEMLELGADSEAAHRAVGEYAAARADVVLAVGPGAHALGGVLLDDRDAAVAWLREHLAEGDAVLVKASRGARLDEVAAALA